jgi:hypothetical protein
MGPENFKVVRPDEAPDVVVFSVFGRQHQGQSAPHLRRVLYTGEAYGRQHARVDFTISFDLDEETPSHMRCPIWQLYVEDCAQGLLQDQLRRAGIPSQQPPPASRERFCSWVASFDCEARESFVRRLSEQVAEVSCGGRRLNNVGGPVDNKHAFLQTSQFSVAMENISRPGYCTEKLLQAFNAGCIPIYWGDQEVGRDFNDRAFINVHQYETYTALWDRINDLRHHPKKLADMVKQPIFSEACRHRLTTGREAWELRLVKGLFGDHFPLKAGSSLPNKG